MTTITLERSDPNLKKTDFKDEGDLLDYLLDKLEIGKLKSLSTKEVKSKRKEIWYKVDSMKNEDFIDIR